MNKLTLVFASVALGFSVAANALLVAAGDVTQDSDTGLEWLDLTLTADLSIDEVQAGVGGFLADGWRVAHVDEVDQLLLNAGWDGIDDVSNNGSPADLIVVNTLLGLLGPTFEGDPVFGEGWALTDLAGRVSRPFYEAEGVQAGFGRIACTSLGFAERPGDGTADFANCGMPSDTKFFFIGVYLVRDTADSDGDGVSNAADNCIFSANPLQEDPDGDGHGRRCDGDFNQDCSVNAIDLGLFKQRFFTADPDANHDGIGAVNAIDLGIFKTLFFQPVGDNSPPGSLCNP